MRELVSMRWYVGRVWRGCWPRGCSPTSTTPSRWSSGTVWSTIRCPESLIQHYASRPLLEQQLRRRLCALPKVTGVRVSRPGRPTADLHAGLVVDATDEGHGRRPYSPNSATGDRRSRS